MVTIDVHTCTWFSGNTCHRKIKYTRGPFIKVCSKLKLIIYSVPSARSLGPCYRMQLHRYLELCLDRTSIFYFLLRTVLSVACTCVACVEFVVVFPTITVSILSGCIRITSISKGFIFAATPASKNLTKWPGRLSLTWGNVSKPTVLDIVCTVVTIATGWMINIRGKVWFVAIVTRWVISMLRKA